MINFGRDVLCITSLRTGRWATDVAVVAQRFFHALTTPRGALQGDEHHANFGDDLTECVGMPGGAVAEAAIRSKVARAASLDDAIRAVTTTMVSSQDDSGDWTHAVTACPRYVSSVVRRTSIGSWRLA